MFSASISDLVWSAVAPSSTFIIDLTSAAVSSFGTAFPLSLPTILLLVIVSSFDKDIWADALMSAFTIVPFTMSADSIV